MSQGYTWIDGGLVPNEHAMLPIKSCVIHYGLGVFEGIRKYRMGIFRLQDHVRMEIQRGAGQARERLHPGEEPLAPADFDVRFGARGC